MASISRARVPFACLVAVLAGGCSSSVSSDSLSKSEAPIVNGKPGGPAQVGRLLWSTPTQSRWWICSGTLVAPDLVLSARHCIYDEATGKPYADETTGTWAFELYDVTTSKFTDKTAIKETLAPPIVASTNFADWQPPWGTPDVALFRLVTPITHVAPLAISSDPVGFVKPLFDTSGFGFTAHKQTAKSDSLSNGISSTQLKLKALDGSYMHTMFPTFDAFLAAIDKVDATARDNESPSTLQDWYDGPLAKGFEGYFAADTDTQPCQGDSGGPLLQQDAAGELKIYGTVSGGLSVSSPNARCEFGEVYSLFNQPVLDFLNMYDLLGTSTAGGSGGAGSGGASSAAAGSAGTSPAGTSSAGSSDASVAGGSSAGSSGAGASTAGASAGAAAGGAGAIAIPSAVAGSPASAGSAGLGVGTTNNANDLGSSSDSGSCSIVNHLNRDSSGLGMVAALIGALAAARRRRRGQVTAQ